MLIILLCTLILYLVGTVIDKVGQFNYFIGGVLPFIGFKTRDTGAVIFRGFYTAWFWRGICWWGILKRKGM